MLTRVVVVFVLSVAGAGLAWAGSSTGAGESGALSAGCITCHNPLDGQCVDPSFEMHSAWGLGPMQQPEHTYCSVGGCHAACGMSEVDERLLESVGKGDTRALRQFLQDHSDAWVNVGRGALQSYSKCRSGKAIALHIPLSQSQILAVAGFGVGHPVGR